jgi:hypothetical protein
MGALVLYGYIVSISISLLYAQWEPDVRLSNGTYHAYTSFNHTHSLATCGDTVHAVWFDGRHGWPNAEIYYCRSLDAGVSWGPETRLTDDSNYSGYPSLAVVGETLHVAYFESFDDDSDIHYMRSTDGGDTWSPDTQLTTNTLMQDFPTIAAWGSTVHLIFTDEKNGNWEIYYLRSIDGGITWDPEQRLTNDPAWTNSPSIAVHGSNVHLAFSDDRASTTHFDIYDKHSSDAGVTWSPDTRVTYTMNNGAPCLGVNDSLLLLAFNSTRDGNYEVYFKRSTNSGTTWEPEERLTDDPEISYLPSMVISKPNIHIAWYDYCSSVLAEIYYLRSTDLGVTWEPQVRLTNDSLRSWWPQIAVGDSAVHVIWSDDRPGIYQIYYKRDPTGNPSAINEYMRNSCILTGDRLTVVPNPCNAYAVVTEHEDEYFILYNSCGMIVGIDRGDRIAMDQPSGIYFIRSLHDNNAISRIIKIE